MINDTRQISENESQVRQDFFLRPGQQITMSKDILLTVSAFASFPITQKFQSVRSTFLTKYFIVQGLLLSQYTHNTSISLRKPDPANFVEGMLKNTTTTGTEVVLVEVHMNKTSTLLVEPDPASRGTQEPDVLRLFLPHQGNIARPTVVQVCTQQNREEESYRSLISETLETAVVVWYILVTAVFNCCLLLYNYLYLLTISCDTSINIPRGGDLR